MVIFLTGAPGTGKSTVGKILADKLNLNFFETDELIEKKTGRSINELFKQGEGYFRYVESEVIRELIRDVSDAVISLGGGAILNKDNLHLIRDKGFVVNLTADLDEILMRLRNDSSRPLLQNNKREKLEKIIRERDKLYRICDFHLDTTQISPEVAAQSIVDFIQILEKANIIRVNLYDRSYDVIVGANIPPACVQNRINRNFPDLKKIALITSPSIRYLELDGDSLYRRIRVIFEELGELLEFDLPEGESTKDILYAIHLWNRFAEIGLRRSDLIVVLGGGVLGDLVGFVASSYLRGVRYINVPTTLLSQIDSSIGGKTAVNTEKAKNVIGTINQPFLVLVDVDFTRTLSHTEFLSGLGEVVKYAVACDGALFSFIFERPNEDIFKDQKTIKHIISRCAKIKANIVSEDEYEEKGLRFVLNFGHTVGHALEAAYNFKIPHGFAVALGCLVETRISDALLGKKNSVLVLELIRKLGFEEDIRIPNAERFSEAILLDKKTRADYLNFVVVDEIGKSRVERIRLDEFLNILTKVLKMQ